jgi:hypothetical protein
MNVVLQGDGSPYGVLEVDSRSEGEFSEHASMANCPRKMPAEI